MVATDAGSARIYWSYPCGIDCCKTDRQHEAGWGLWCLRRWGRWGGADRDRGRGSSVHSAVVDRQLKGYTRVTGNRWGYPGGRESGGARKFTASTGRPRIGQSVAAINIAGSTGERYRLTLIDRRRSGQHRSCRGVVCGDMDCNRGTGADGAIVDREG